MAVTERQRHQLFERLGETLGEAEAEVLMEYLPPVGWGDVATKRDLDAVCTELQGGMALLRTELQGDMARLEARFHADQVTFMRLLIGSQFMLAVIFVLAQALG